MDDDTPSCRPGPGPAPEVPGYDVGRLLGSGGTAAVWLATELGTHREVALKCLPAAGPPGGPPGGPAQPGDAGDAEAAVRREVRILSALDHGHLVKARAVVPVRYGTTGGAGLALVLDYAAGGSLADLLAARGSLGPGEAVTVLVPIAQALAYLHANGFTHGDVSPGNVLFTAQGKPLLADLGVARMLADPRELSRPGTDGFRDPAPVDAVRAGLQPEGDVYSVAALGWFCLTGRAPEPEPQRPPLPLLVQGVPAGLAEALEAGLRTDRRQRPSAAELAAAVYRSAPAAPVDLSVSVHPSVLPQLLTRRTVPAGARERRAEWLRAWRGRVPGRARHAVRPVGRRRSLRRAAAAVVVAAIVTTAGIFAAPLQAGPAPSSGPQPVPSHGPSSGPAAQAKGKPDAAASEAVPAELQELLAAARPEDAVQGLAGLRSYALRTGNLGLLEQVTVPASPAAAADAELGSRLAGSGHVLEGFEARLSGLQRQPGSTAGRAVVSLRVASPPYRERDAAGTVVAEAAASGDRALRLVLVPVGGKWRIQEILAGTGG